MLRSSLSLSVGFVFLVAGCGAPSSPKVSTATNSKGSTESAKSVAGDKKLNIGGATFVYPMMDKWSFEYQKQKGVKVNYTSMGSGSGIQQMMAQTLDFGCSDAPMTDKQMAEAKSKNGDVVHIPLVMGADVPAYNLKISQTLKFTGPVLADIFLGKITKWNDPALKAINPGVDLPDQGIAVCHRSDGSGTTYIWADYLAKVSPEWKEKVGVSTSLKFPVGVGNKGNEGVAGFVKSNEGAIGYVELIYALQNGIKFGSVQNRAGNFVTADLASVAAAGATAEIPDDLRYSLTNPDGKDVYPIAGTNWAIVYVKQPEAKKQAIVDFLTWVTHDGQELCEPLHFARLPQSLVQKVEKKLERIKSGS
jgi:phosphate ABC transporter phosphate-binding protein